MIEQKITIGVMLSVSPVKLHYHVILMKETQNGPFIHFSHKNLVEIILICCLTLLWKINI